VSFSELENDPLNQAEVNEIKINENKCPPVTKRVSRQSYSAVPFVTMKQNKS
jgi:hypothetical protein